MKEYYQHIFNSFKNKENRMFFLNGPERLTAWLRVFFDVGDKIVMYYNNLNILENEAIIYSITNFLNRNGELHIKYSESFPDTAMINSFCRRNKVSMKKIEHREVYNFIVVDDKSYLLQFDITNAEMMIHTYESELSEKMLNKFKGF